MAMLRRALVILAVAVTVLPTAEAGESSAARRGGLARSVTIYRDTYGVPHIYGSTDAGVVFGLMYAQAEDNFWQLEEDYVHGLGRAAELYGEKDLVAQLLYRAFEVDRKAKEEYRQAPPALRALCEAFAAGVNYYLETHPEVKPRLLARFEPWFIFAFERGVPWSALAAAGVKPDEVRAAIPEITRLKGLPGASPASVFSKTLFPAVRIIPAFGMGRLADSPTRILEFFP
jgi:acyl-homoserine lactone acylase PvdQ